MKIYCAAKRNTQDISKYLGKDVWVLIMYNNQQFWVKFLEESALTPGRFVVQSVPCSFIGREMTDRMRTAMFCPKWMDMLDMDILTPIEIRSTEEICNLYGIPYEVTE